MVPLRRVANIVNGGTPTSDGRNWDGRVPWATPVDLASVDGGHLSATQRLLTEEGLRTGSRTVPTGSLIISTRAPIGYVAQVNQVTAFNQGCRGLVPRESCDGRFLQYALISQTDVLQSLGTGSTFLELSTEALANVMVPLPPLEEQRRIANYLDDQTTRIDQTIQLRQKQQRALTEWSASSWKEAADELVDAYGAIPLRRVLSSITDGPFGSSLKSTHYSDSGVRVIRLGNIGLGEFRNGDEAFIDEAYAAELSEHSVIAGDLVVAGLGDDRWPLGRATVIPASVGPAIVKADCYRVRLRPMVLHGFAAWFLSSPVGGACFNLLARGSTRQRLNTDVVRDVLLPVPPLSVQVNALRDWESRHRVISEAHRTFDDSIRLLMERRRSLITAAVSGELDVSSGSSRAADVVVSGVGGGV